MNLTIENFRDHPSRRYEPLQRIHFFEGEFLLSDPANLLRIRLLSLDTGNLGDPYESLVTLQYLLLHPKADRETQVMELTYNSAANLAVFCSTNQIELEVSSSLSSHKEYIKRLEWWHRAKE